MIANWFIGLWVGGFGWVCSLVPTFNQSVTNVGLMGILAPVSVGAGQLGAWIPWQLLGLLAPVVITFYLAAMVLRIIKSFLPTISG